MIKKKDELKLLFLGLFLIFLDLFSKFFFIDKNYFTNYFIFISGTQNFGSSFGSFSTIPFYSYLIFFLSIIFVTIMIIKRDFFYKNKYLISSFILIISGVLGNAIDRIFYGFVRDFIAIKHLFIFNIADIYIFFGVILYLLFELSSYKFLKKGK